MSVQQGKENPQYALRWFQAQRETAQIRRERRAGAICTTHGQNPKPGPFAPK
jgi:hypothetical protein